MLKTSKHDAMAQCQSQRASPGQLLRPYINAPKTSVSRGILSCPVHPMLPNRPLSIHQSTPRKNKHSLPKMKISSGHEEKEGVLCVKHGPPIIRSPV